MRYLSLFIFTYFLVLGCSKKVTEKDVTTKDIAKLETRFDSLLNSFEEMKISIEKSRAQVDKYKDFLITHIKSNNDREEYKKALISDRLTKDFILYVNDIKETLENRAVSNDDISSHKSFMIDGGKGEELKIKINATRKQLLALLTEEEQKQVTTDLIAEDPNDKQTWESELFEHTPLDAVVALLDKIKSDASNTNVQVIHLLLERTK